MLFSEPKIPQCTESTLIRRTIWSVSVLFSEPKIPQLRRSYAHNWRNAVSVLFSEPKIPQSNGQVGDEMWIIVSVLFSEPKIPQSTIAGTRFSFSTTFQCSSASRKFLNAMRRISGRRAHHSVSVLFSEPKIPQWRTRRFCSYKSTCFSALQRAENSSIPTLAPASIHISDRDDHASSFLSLPGASP